MVLFYFFNSLIFVVDVLLFALIWIIYQETYSLSQLYVRGATITCCLLLLGIIRCAIGMSNTKLGKTNSEGDSTDISTPSLTLNRLYVILTVLLMNGLFLGMLCYDDFMRGVRETIVDKYSELSEVQQDTIKRILKCTGNCKEKLSDTYDISKKTIHGIIIGLFTLESISVVIYILK